jgi:hypothetical protein
MPQATTSLPSTPSLAAGCLLRSRDFLLRPRLLARISPVSGQGSLDVRVAALKSGERRSL